MPGLHRARLRHQAKATVPAPRAATPAPNHAGESLAAGTVGASLLARQAEQIAELEAELRVARQEIARLKAELGQFRTLEGE